MKMSERYIKIQDKNGNPKIKDQWDEKEFNNMFDENLLKQINSDWESRQYQKEKRKEAESVRDIAVTVVEGFLALEKLKKIWFISEYD